MEAGDLHRAVQVQLGQQGFGHVQEVVEFQEVGQHAGAHQQAGLDLGFRGVQQALQFSPQILQQCQRFGGLADLDVQPLLLQHGVGEGAQVQADDGLLHPEAGGGKDGRRVGNDARCRRAVGRPGAVRCGRTVLGGMEGAAGRG